MLFIKPKNKDGFYGVLGVVSEHVISVSQNPGIKGFEVFRDESMAFKLGDYDGFTTVYRELPDEIQLSDDGSIYVPPTPKPPLHSQMIINGVEYDAINFSTENDLEWGMKGRADEIGEILQNTDEIIVDDIAYTNLVYQACYQAGDYVHCRMHQKTAEEMAIDELREEIIRMNGELAIDAERLTYQEGKTDELSEDIANNEALDEDQDIAIIEMDMAVADNENTDNDQDFSIIELDMRIAALEEALNI